MSKQWSIPVKSKLLRWMAASIFLVVGGSLLWAYEEEATNQCLTEYDICSVSWGPEGSECSCPSGDGGKFGYRVLTGDDCETDHGVCRVSPAPLGEYCECGRDPGRVVR